MIDNTMLAFWNKSKMFDNPYESPVYWHLEKRFQSKFYDDRSNDERAKLA
jgi:hypothetical protein